MNLLGQGKYDKVMAWKCEKYNKAMTWNEDSKGVRWQLGTEQKALSLLEPNCSNTMENIRKLNDSACIIQVQGKCILLVL